MVAAMSPPPRLRCAKCKRKHDAQNQRKPHAAASAAFIAQVAGLSLPPDSLARPRGAYPAGRRRRVGFIAELKA
jgi:hypothetical protein